MRRRERERERESRVCVDEEKKTDSAETKKEKHTTTVKPPSLLSLPHSSHHLRAGKSSLTPAQIDPHPIRRQCFSTRRDSATFSPSLVHTGDVRASLARSPLTATTRAPVQHDVEHEDFGFRQFGDFAFLLALGRAHTQQPAQQEKVDLQLGEHVGQGADLAKHLADQAVGASQSGVDGGADTDQTAGNCVLQLILLRKQ